MKYTPTETTKLVKNLTRKKLYEMMKEGEISFNSQEWGSKSRRFIDASELIRVFKNRFHPKGIKEPLENVTEKHFGTFHETEENTEKTTVFQEKILIRDEKIENLKETILEIKKDRDNWRDQANKLLLTSPIETNLLKTSKKRNLLLVTIGLVMTTSLFFVGYYIKVFLIDYV